jgi:anti-sigma regulatory factor (Ser/Thr protein kinase)
MSAAEFRRSVTIQAVPDQVRAARVFVAVTNSVRHSGSAVPGGVVAVTVAAGAEVVRVEVTDRCGDGVPVLPSAVRRRRGGGERGLWLVDALSARWGLQRGRRPRDDLVLGQC